MAEQILDKENGAIRIGLGPALSMLASNVMAAGNVNVVRRIIIAATMIGLARVAVVLTPLAYGWAVDHVSVGEGALMSPSCGGCSVVMRWPVSASKSLMRAVNMSLPVLLSGDPLRRAEDL